MMASFPYSLALEVVDVRGSYFSTLPAVTGAKRICVRVDEYGQCVARYGAQVCTSNDTCATHASCGSARMRQPEQFLAAYDSYVRESCCSSCKSECYQKSILGNEPFLTAPPSGVTPTPVTLAPTPLGLACSVPSKAVLGSCAGIVTQAVPPPYATMPQPSLNSMFVTLDSYASVIPAACMTSLKKMGCAIEYPRCSAASQLLRPCLSMCNEVNQLCSSIIPFVGEYKSFFDCGSNVLPNSTIPAFVNGTSPCFV